MHEAEKKIYGVVLGIMGVIALLNCSLQNAQSTQNVQSVNVQTAGTIAGEFKVTEGGAAAYNIPVTVPPGTNGMQPELTLVYSSQQGNGLLGVGWQLSGIPLITRCGATKLRDGFDGTVSGNRTDRFCLDGKRLIAVYDAVGNLLETTAARNAAYGREGTVYHTETESWADIVSHTGTGTNGPLWFEVRRKTGMKIEFGNTADSRIMKVISIIPSVSLLREGTL